MVKRIMWLVVGICVLLVMACDNNKHNGNPPPVRWDNENGITYRFVGCSSVVIKMEGKEYTIKQYDDLDGDKHSIYPFTYTFEDDGDVDIYIDGRHIADLDSPCDELSDMLKSKKKKKVTPTIIVSPAIIKQPVSAPSKLTTSKTTTTATNSLKIPKTTTTKTNSIKIPKTTTTATNSLKIPKKKTVAKKKTKKKK